MIDSVDTKNIKFIKNYIQVLSGVTCIIISWFGYMSGEMYVYGNISKNIDNINFIKMITSYLFLPLCITVMVFGIMLHYSVKNDYLHITNKFLLAVMIIIGFIGTRLYFVIPTLMISIIFLIDYKLKLLNHTTYNNTNLDEKSDDNNEHTKKYNPIKDVKTTKNKSANVEMALSLLYKNADKQFINEITGISIEELYSLEKSFKESTD